MNCHIPTYSLFGGRLRKTAAMLLLLLCGLLPSALVAQVNISIGGDVYGGGRNGHVGTAQVVDAAAEKEDVAFTDDLTAATEVNIHQGAIRTVFGGGENGRIYGGTSVTVTDQAVIGSTTWRNTIHGGLFGAGDGAAAYVFGHSQVTVKGGQLLQNVYGGGNQADLMGTTTVLLQGGDFRGAVFGGARMADIYGYTYVDIDGANIKSDLLVDAVYGGNDISGNISSSETWDWTKTVALSLPAALTHAAENSINTTWNAFLHSSAEKTPGAGETQKHIFVGKLYGGGNGDYPGAYDGGSLTLTDSVSDYQGNLKNAVFSDLNRPIMDRTYLEIGGGTFGYVFGGGDAATVRRSVDICLDNTSTVIASQQLDELQADVVAGEKTWKDKTRLADMDINWSTFTDQYQFVRVFGGNDQADMDIRPNWYLLQGSVNNLFSGGNQGAMTSPTGILLPLLSADMTVHNVYGGCRMADVDPRGDKGEGEDMPAETFDGETMEQGYAARVLVKAGHITNVYGGNDITGSVYYGANVHILNNIEGDVYGGGNGSYAYTDNAALSSDLIYGDFYYDPSAAASSVEALNLFRPNTESVSLSVRGESSSNPTLIGGSIYCGGNSTTLRGHSGKVASSKLKIGSYVMADEVFLGNNGLNMVDTLDNGVLYKYANSVEDADGNTLDFSSLDLTQSATFATYMYGAAMSILPMVEFADNYVEYSTLFGSFYCGGNVGSMTYSGINEIVFDDKVVIFNKLVGGCNNANVPAHDGLNAAFEGGILGSADERGSYIDGSGNIRDRLRLTLSGVKVQPKRWLKDGDAYVLDANGNRQLEWNTFDVRTREDVTPPTTLPAGGISSENDMNRRLRGGNVYGGCYNSGHVNGNVVINLNGSIIDRNLVFDQVDEDSTGVKLYDNDKYYILTRNSGVILDEQGMDVLGAALNVFGGGYGEDAEIWGSATVNLTKGYTFQIFGGGERGAIGKKKTDAGGNALRDAYGRYVYEYDERYSTYVNLNGNNTGVARLASGDTPDMAESEFIYGGGFEGPIAGNTRINLGNGRIFNSFAGSCNADILGHTETYVGLGNNDGSRLGFPWVRDHIYGGNDLGGRILGEKNFKSRVSATAIDKVYNPLGKSDPDVLVASAYIEYLQGHVEYIFGGCYGDYDYTDPLYDAYTYTTGGTGTTSGNLGHPRPGFTKPRMENAFVNFKPNDRATNRVDRIYGAGQGHTGEIGKDSLQNRSYVLVDVPQNLTTFKNSEIFGAGDYSGLGMGVNPEEARTNADAVTAAAVIDLVRGQINSVYGGSFSEGVTRRTIVNVPEGSTVSLVNIFGGAYGLTNEVPCDVYESHVNYDSEEAVVSWGLFGGNNNARRTLYTQLNISSVVWSDRSRGYTGYAYGGGYGADTWAQYTEVNLNDGADLYKVYGGGSAGKVLNKASVEAWRDRTVAAGGALDLTLGAGYAEDNGSGYTVAGSSYENEFLNTGLARSVDLATDLADGSVKDGLGIVQKYNTNVRINQGGYVSGYCYGGGYGLEAVVSGATYISLLGGEVGRDIYAAGESGAVKNLYEDKDAVTFIAAANAYVQSGSVRNVYGGGWRGDVGYHDASTISVENDIPGITNVVVGKLDGTAYLDGVPAVLRNAYGGGEGGSIYGRAHLTVNNGYVGYRYEGGSYVEELEDSGYDTPNTMLDDAGNAFGGGYVANSYTDTTYVTMYGGTLRGSLYGGAEIGPIGRGTLKDDAPTDASTFINGPDNEAKIYKAGETHVYLYKGNVLRDVFGGGRGFDNWGGDGTKFYTAEEVATMDLKSKGFVFGSTDVHVYGGTVGTTEGVALGYGNVFGGGNLGYVYSATGKKVGVRATDETLVEGMPTDGGGFYYLDGNKDNNMTLDCNVEVAPACLVTDAGGITIDGKTFAQGDYVPVDYLNKLKNKTSDAAQWDKMNLDGIHIHNAVFAGGNVSSGSDQIFINTKTVYGNASAALRDVYHRDLITIGTEHTGGLYGDGNLTFVDGYRELHISNYGTDFYGLSDQITLEEYYALNDRERAYFELKYDCKAHCEDKDGKPYDAGAQLTAEEYKELFEGTAYYNSDYWVEAGFCSIYAGRLLNTIQRADMVGVFGSRMVLQGARDRVPEKADYTNYTINRVGELSLNQAVSQAGDVTEEDRVHGNYFGIYSVVNYLGNLTSDVTMDDVRTTDNSSASYAADGTTSYYTWKLNNKDKPNRNNGTSQNKVALASGVYLEITREEGEGTGETQWGYVTGVIELDLINVLQGQGGGSVYAKNEHRTKTHHPEWSQVILSPYNENCRTYRKFSYSENYEEIETSGNFIHNLKQIVDDCYPTANSYQGEGAAPAHYWYIKGSIYVYDQYISAYTGSATAYSENVSIPLTVTAQSRGKMLLYDIKPNYYAYYEEDGTSRIGTTGETTMINNVTYSLNDPITYWDYMLLGSEDKARFVRETYTTVAKAQIGETVYPKGYTMLPDEYEALLAATTDSIYNLDREEKVLFTDVFRPTNNLSHTTGYVLTYDINNPMEWNDWHTPATGDMSLANRLNIKQYTGQAGYLEAPTYYLNTGRAGVYGQREYNQGDIITSRVYDTYMGIPAANREALTEQADFAEAWVVTAELTTRNKDDVEQHLYPGVAIAKSDYTDAQWSAISSKVALASVVTSTLALSETDYIYVGDLLSAAQLADLQATYPTLTDEVLEEYTAKAYICTEGGNYGGDLFETGTAYRAIDTWCAMSSEERADFSFNYDALDVLIDPAYTGNTALYDGTNSPSLYSAYQPIDYDAIYKGASNLTYFDSNDTEVTVHPNDKLSRTEYEGIPNERYFYTAVEVTAPGNYYIVKNTFVRGEVPYTAGQTLSDEVYGSLSTDQQANVAVVSFTAEQAGTPTTVGDVTTYSTVIYYYCRNSYVVGQNGSVTGTPTSFEDIAGTTYGDGATVPQGTIVSDSEIENVVNLQTDFTIVGNTPIETSTLYVSRESDIFDLNKDKVITVMFLYEYEESDEAGLHIIPVTEQHILNIHLQFKSGVPEIGQLNKPKTVLPGSSVGLKVPSVTPGAYEVLSSGWEVFSNDHDAASHKNGQPFYNNVTPVYWYQNGYYVAYYAKTYLGKTYSNAVPFSVANYHDLATVMNDKDHHYYIDHRDVDRSSKIYLNNYSSSGKNALDLLNDLVDLSYETLTYVDEAPVRVSGGRLDGHVPMESRVEGGANLEFILRTNVSHNESWTPIADGEGECFEGVFHGDGYTISGLDHSLFGHLCGDVYNLGVTGSFSGGGVADQGEGYVENCWIATTGTPAEGVYAVFGHPTRTGEDHLLQIVNSYYPDTLAYAVPADNTHGQATAMPAQAFYNGEVTYNLNGFYLSKRYNDHASHADTEAKYSFFDAYDEMTVKEIQYQDEANYTPGYVEYRYEDGDFVYAGGSIPESDNVRMIETSGGVHYYPIWPDDYLFFGQTLTYGYDDVRTHQDDPSHINKSGDRLASSGSNRVYRAPAYFRNKTMSKAHFNADAVFAAISEDESHEVYPDMTAIDFTGYNDVSKGYKHRMDEHGFFYAPLLDDDGLINFHNEDLTRNLLVYVPASTGNENDAATKTYNTLSTRLSEPAYTETDADYRTVDVVSSTTIEGIHGHAVYQNGGSYSATNDHLLVDKEDFNAPIAYSFATGMRMWYQRTPDNYVSASTGWEGVSLPFAAELVTTQDKGEITHFYSGSRSVDENTGSKVGHEYWLREFQGIKAHSAEADTARFAYPEAVAGDDKVVDNTFLWDYYYSRESRQDAHRDKYQTYYKTSRTYEDYPLLAKATPYIVGFPGSRYYEFDMSGSFSAQHTYGTAPARLEAQTVTFASATGADIAVSDDELSAAKTAKDGYVFTPSYLRETFDAGTADIYTLDALGSRYETVPAAPGAGDPAVDPVVVLPFRPYFAAAPVSPAPRRRASALYIGSLDNSQTLRPALTGEGRLDVYGSKLTVWVESTLDVATTVVVTNVAGIQVARVLVAPHTKVAVPVASEGIYIVNRQKIAVPR